MMQSINRKRVSVSIQLIVSLKIHMSTQISLKDTNMPRKSVSPEKRAGCRKYQDDVFFKNIQGRRLELNITQEKMAEKLDMMRPNYSRLEGGAFPKNPRKIVEIAEALNVDINWLFGFNQPHGND